jgi:hypothetical protein
VYPPLLELWTKALAAAESAIAAATRAHILTPRDATEARRVLEAEVRWLATAGGR